MFEKRKEAHGDRVVTTYAARPASVDAFFRQAAAENPGRAAIVEDGRRISYADLDGQVGSVARGLAERGVGAGDRIAVMLANCAEAVIAVLAAARLGAVVTPIGTRLRRPEITYILQDSAPSALIFGAEHSGELPDAGIAGPVEDMRFAVGEPCRGARPFAALRGLAPMADNPDVRESDAFGLLYTSGTTGRPKGAIISHFNAVHSCLHWREAHRLRPDETTVLAIPWGHVAGLCGVVLPFLSLGATLVMMRDFRAGAFLDLAAAERITHALLVPAMYGLCLLEPDLDARDLSTWRLGVFGGAPMPEATIRRFAAALPGLTMCNAYGATETSSPATIMPSDADGGPLDSIGKAAPCAEFVVMDEEGRESPPGEKGELWIRGPMIVSGYWGNQAATADSFVAGFWKSGDIGSVDADGFVRILDRKKDMVNRGGFKIYPAEVENHLVEHPLVVEAAIVGRPDEILTERAIAFVHARDGSLTEAAMRRHCEGSLADYKTPDRFVISTGELPRNANGKIQKDQLREIARSLDG